MRMRGCMHQRIVLNIAVLSQQQLVGRLTTKPRDLRHWTCQRTALDRPSALNHLKQLGFLLAEVGGGG